MNDKPAPARSALVAMALAMALVLSACGGTAQQRRGELAELARLLPGDYDNLEQVRASEPGAVPGVRMVIVPVYAPLVGEDIFYVQEMAADDPRRVIAQRLINLEITPDGRVLQGIFVFEEGGRWRDGHQRPDVFKSLLPNDLKLVEGCDLEWRAAGRRFTARNNPATCRVARPGSGEPARRESRMELDEDGIAISDVLIDAAGQRQPPGELWLRLRRRPG